MVRASAGHSVTGVYTQLQIGLNDKMDSYSKNTGALKVVGGMGVSSNVNIGGSMIIDGDLTVLGSKTVNTTVDLITEDKNIILGNIATPTDSTARGGGIILKGSTDKHITWGLNPTGNVSNTSWNFDNEINLASNKTYNINDVNVLSNDTLGSTVINSSLTGVGTLSSGSISSNFGDIDIGTNKITGGNLVIKSDGSDVFNINSSTGITQSIKSSLSNSTTITGFNQGQLDDSYLLKINKTFTGEQLSGNISKAVNLNSTFDSTTNKNQNNTLFVESTHSGINSTGGSLHNHFKTVQNFSASFNATHNINSRLSSYGINSTSNTQQLGYNIGGFFEAGNADIENSGIIAVGSGSNSVDLGIFGTVNQTREQIGTYIKSTLYDSLGGIKSGLFAYNPTKSSKNFALYTDGHNYLGGNTKLNGTLSISDTSSFFSNIFLDNSSISYTDGTDTYNTGIKNSKLTISNNSNDVLTVSNNGQVKINTTTNATSSTTGALVVSGGVGIGGDLHVSGIIKAADGTSGTIIIGDNSNNDNVEINAELASDIIPNTSTSHDLGSSTKQWKDLYVDGVSNLDQTNINTTDGNFNVTGSGITDIDTDADFSGDVIFSKGYSENSVEIKGGLKLTQNNSTLILKASTSSGNVTYSFPNSYGSPNQVLTDDGAGNLFWNNSQDATNIGNSGYSIYKQITNNVMQFKKIDAGTNISISDLNDVITINSTFGTHDNNLINGNLNIQKQLSVSGNTILSNVQINDNLTVNSPDLLFNSNLTVGSDNNGKNIKFFGTSSGNYIDYNYTNNQLRINAPTNSTALNVTSGNANFSDNITVSGTSNLTNALISNNLNINGLTTISDTLITNANISNNLSVNGVTSLKNTTITGNSIIDGNLNVSDTISGNLSGTLLTGSQTNITDVGTLNDLTVSGNVTIGGDLNVSGTTVTVSSDNLNITDPILLIGSSSTSNSDQGLIADRTSATNVGMVWNETNKEFTYIYTENNGTVSGNVSLKTTDGINGYADLHSANFTIEKELTFNNTTKNIINLPTNTSDALVIQKDDINKYMTFSTNTSSGKKIYIHKELAAAGVPVSGSNFTLTGGSINNMPIGDTTKNTGKFTTLEATTSITGTLATADQPNITSLGTLSSVDINGGTIDNTPIGSNSHNTGKFTTLEATNATTISNTLSVSSQLTCSSDIRSNYTTGGVSWTSTLHTSAGGSYLVFDDADPPLLSGSDYFVIHRDPSTNVTRFLNCGSGTAEWYMNADGSSTWGLEGVPKMTLKADGKLGIGTTSPGATLDVDGTTKISNTLSVGNKTVLNSTLSIGEATTLNSTLSVGNATVLNSTLSVNNATTLRNTLSVGNATILNSTLSVGNTTILKSILSVGNATVLESTLSVGNKTILKSTLSVGNATVLKSTLSVGDHVVVKSFNVLYDTVLNNRLSVGFESYFYDDVTINGSLSVNLPSTFTDKVDIHGDLNILDNYSTNLNDTYISGTLSVNELTTITNSLTIENSLSINGPTTINNILSIKDATILKSTLSVGKSTILESTLSVGNKTLLNSTLNVVGNVSFNNSANIGSVLSVKENTILSSILSVGKDVILESTLSVSNNLLVGTANLFVDTQNNGNVGIGTTYPKTVLDINSSLTGGASDGIIIKTPWDSNNQETFLKLGTTDTNYAQISAHTKPGDKTYLKFKTQSSLNDINDVMTIDPIGNVGIGTTNPITPLNIQSSSTNIEALRIQSNGNDGNIVGQTYMGIDHFTNTTYPSIRLGCEEIDNASWQSNFVIQTRDTTSDSLPTTKLTVQPNGNIGIGTTSPGTKLEVKGPWDGLLKLTPDNGSSTYLNTGTNNFELAVANGTRTALAVKHTDGNVGIGTTNPEATLDVVGSIKTSGNITIDGNLIVTGTTATVSNNSTFTGNVNIANYLIYQRESIDSTASSFTLNNNKIISEITIDTDNSSGTLDDGHTYGQVKRVVIVYVDGTKTFRLNITNFVHGSYIDFYNTGQSAELIWTQSRTSGINDAWCLVGGSGGLVVA